MLPGYSDTMTDKSEPLPSEHTHPVRRLDTPEAREYAEWCLLVLDFERCLRLAQLWKDIDKDRDKDGDRDVATSLFRDAVVSFKACFDKNNTVSLDPSTLYQPHEGGVEYYQWLSTVRDTWVAHRHGASRQAYAAILVDQSSGDFIGIGHAAMTYSRPVLQGAEDFIRFISIALADARARRDRAMAVAESQAKSLTPEQRLRLPVAKMKAAAGGELRLGRRKFSNILRPAELEQRNRLQRMHDDEE